MDIMKKVILKIKSGSSLYGTRTPSSDNDYIGIFIPQDDYIVGLQKVEQRFDNIISKDENGKNNKDAIDCTYYELRKFLNLCLQGNPNIFEVLFVNEENIVEITEEGRELLNLKHCFISEKVINNTYGYINGMKRKLDLRQSTLEPLVSLKERIEELCKNEEISYTEPIAKLEQYSDFINSVTVDKYQYAVGKFNIQRNGTINNALTQLKDILENKTNRQSLVAKYGYDTKSAHHLLRLYYQIIELLTENQIVYPLRMSEDLIRIKTGQIPYELFEQMITDLHDICKELEQNYKLPKKPNYNSINNYCKKTLINNLG